VRPSVDAVWTIGYSGRALEEFLHVLLQARVEVVVDVRELPLSRRKGFSKTALSRALESVGIEYRHVRAAGNPFRAQKADIERCLALYSRHLEQTSAVLEELEELLRARRCALLCFEAEARVCHRSIISEQLRQMHPKLVVIDL